MAITKLIKTSNSRATIHIHISQLTNPVVGMKPSIPLKTE
jgi:hypothetical protein